MASNSLSTAATRICSELAAALLELGLTCTPDRWWRGTAASPLLFRRGRRLPAGVAGMSRQHTLQYHHDSQQAKAGY